MVKVTGSQSAKKNIFQLKAIESGRPEFAFYRVPSAFSLYNLTRRTKRVVYLWRVQCSVSINISALTRCTCPGVPGWTESRPRPRVPMTSSWRHAVWLWRHAVGGSGREILLCMSDFLRAPLPHRHATLVINVKNKNSYRHVDGNVGYCLWTHWKQQESE